MGTNWSQIDNWRKSKIQCHENQFKKYFYVRKSFVKFVRFWKSFVKSFVIPQVKMEIVRIFSPIVRWIEISGWIQLGKIRNISMHWFSLNPAWDLNPTRLLRTILKKFTSDFTSDFENRSYERFYERFFTNDFLFFTYDF